MPSIKVSIIIPALNEEKLISSCLTAILANTDDDTEVFLVDNGSTDRTSEIAKSFPRVQLIRCEKNGVMNAREAGYLKSTGEIVAFVDADTRISKGWIQTIKNRFDKDKNLACICGPYKYYDLSPFEQFLAYIYWNVIAYSLYILIGYIGNFGNMAIRRRVLEKMGGLDTSIVFYGDDTATARKASEFGRVKYDLTLIAESSGRRFAKQGLLKTTLTYAVNFFSQIFFKKSISKKYEEYR